MPLFDFFLAFRRRLHGRRSLVVHESIEVIPRGETVRICATLVFFKSFAEICSDPAVQRVAYVGDDIDERVSHVATFVAV